MRSFHPLPLLSSVFLFACSLARAQRSYLHEKAHARYRHVNNNYKRDTTNAVFTYFNDGLGACGTTNGPNDFIVALNSAQYDGGIHCFEMITLTVGGKTAQAQITDECGSCDSSGLDLSQGLFEYFAPLSEGELDGSWSYNSDSSSTSATPTTSTPATTVASTTTSSPQPSSTTTTTTTMTMASSAFTTIPSPTSITPIVPTSTPQNPQVIAQIELLLLELGTLFQVSLQL